MMTPLGNFTGARGGGTSPIRHTKDAQTTNELELNPLRLGDLMDRITHEMDEGRQSKPHNKAPEALFQDSKVGAGSQSIQYEHGSQTEHARGRESGHSAAVPRRTSSRDFMNQHIQSNMINLSASMGFTQAAMNQVQGVNEMAIMEDSSPLREDIRIMGQHHQRPHLMSVLAQQPSALLTG